VTVRVRFAHLHSVTRSATLSDAISTTLTLTEVAEALAWSAIGNDREREITLLAVSLSNLRPQHSVQLELPIASNQRPGAGYRISAEVEASRWGVDRSVDAIRERFGRALVGYATVVLSDSERVPEEFRELGQKESGQQKTTA
jgi:DNA polymerase IV